MRRPVCAILVLCSLAMLLVAADQTDEPQPIPVEQEATTVDENGTALEATAEGEAEPDESMSRHPGPVSYIPISGEFDRWQQSYVGKALDDAYAEGTGTVVLHITSPGGYLGVALHLMERLLEAPKDIRLVAFVDSEAISAAAATAYCAHEIYMTGSSMIGNIGIIMVKQDGSFEYAPEKIETYLRAKLALAADARGWSRAQLLKMTARNQKLYQVIIAEDDRRWVIGDDLPTVLAEHDIDADDTRRIIEKLGEDRLLTLPAREAVERSMATAVVADREALYRQLGIDPGEVIDRSPTGNELLARLLAGWAPLLAGLAVMFVLFELKTPGVGIWAALAGLCALGFFFCQFYLQLASSVELILLIVGLGLIIAEIATWWSGGIGLAAGGLIAIAALISSYVPNETTFDSDGLGDMLGSALLQTLVSVSVAGVGAVLIISTLSRNPLARRLLLTSEVPRGDGMAASENLIGRRVRVRSDLHPGGSLEIDGIEHSVVTEHGQFVAAGAEVEIVGRRLSDLVVRPLREVTA